MDAGLCLGLQSSIRRRHGAGRHLEIKNVPTGVDLQVMAWHEVGTPVLGTEIKKGQLKDGDVLEAKIKKK